MLLDKEQKIARPRQIYTGITTRDYPGKGINLTHKVLK
jgi:citrate synthase